MCNSNDEDDERFWNFMIYKVWATDKEMEEMDPMYYGIAIIIILIIIGIAALFGAYN